MLKVITGHNDSADYVIPQDQCTVNSAIYEHNNIYVYNDKM